MPNLSGSRPLILGHRGAHGIKSVSENTFAAFDRALADGCDGFEFDVRITSDGVPVICHDARFRGIEIARASEKQCAELPRLEQVLERYADRAFLDIELKVQGLENVTADLLKKYLPRRGFVVSSFLPMVLRALNAQHPEMPLGLICEEERQLVRWSQLPVKYLIAQRDLVTPAVLRERKDAGKKLLVWTVNSPEDMRRFRQLGVDGIISDDPKLLAQAIGA